MYYTLCVTQCTIEKFTKQLLGEREVEAVLTRLDRLTKEEARMTVAQTFGVVHGLVSNVRIVMEGRKCPHVVAGILLEAYSIRWQGIDRQHSTRFGYVAREIGISLLSWDRSRS
jgi:hypothetical protein